MNIELCSFQKNSEHLCAFKQNNDVNDFYMMLIVLKCTCQYMKQSGFVYFYTCNRLLLFHYHFINDVIDIFNILG